MPAPMHYRVTATGSLGEPTAPSDIFSFGLALRYNSTAPKSKAQLATDADLIYPRFATLVQACCTTAARLERVRIALVGADGKYARDDSGAYVLGDSTAAPVVGSDTSWKPLQVSLAVSLFSNFEGPTGRGRFYIPAPGQAVNRDGRIAAAGMTAFNTALDNFFTGLNLDLGAGTEDPIVIASGGSATKGLPPAIHSVVGARIGDVFDTQRRRRNALDETYSTIDVAF